MRLLCLIGSHKWDGCKCDKCGKVRNEQHNWKKDCEKCEKCGKEREDGHDWSKDCERCLKCGKKSSHKWDGCKCDRCGKIRNEQHNWENGKCSKCNEFRVIKSSGDNWYFTRTKDGKISQVVLSCPVSTVKETEFAMIMLPGDLFPIVSTLPWCTGFIRMYGKPVPYQMVRVDEFAKDIKYCDMTIAFSFCKLSTAGIFLIDTRIDNVALGSLVRQKFPFLPPIKKPVAEWVVSMNDSYSIEMIKDIFSSETLNIIVANSEGAKTRTLEDDGSWTECMGPYAHHERTVFLDSNVKKLLKEELNYLISYHKSIPSSQRNFQQANSELGDLLPLDKDPIFNKQN